MASDFTLEQKKAIALANARKRMAGAQQAPQQPQGIPALKKGIDIATQAANLGNAYLQGRTFGVVPKAMSAIGAGMAYPVVAAGKAIQGEEIPSYADLYKTGVKGFQGSVEQSREDNPLLSAGAELAGGLKTATQLGATKLGQGIGNWVKGQPLQQGATAGQKALGLLGKAGRGALTGEAGYRAYKVGSAAPGQEADEAVSGFPVGGIAGGAAPVLGAGISAGKRALTPTIEDSGKRAFELAKKYNIPLGLDDITESKFYKGLISEGESIPFSGAGKNKEAQAKAFTKAVAKSIGLDDVDSLRVEQIDEAFDKVGKQFDSLTKGKKFSINDDVLEGLDDVRAVAENGGFGSEGQKLLDKHLKEIYATINESGDIAGESLAKVRASLNAVARRGSNPDAKALAGELESVLSDFISQDAPDVLRNAKYQYKNLIAIEPLVQKSQIKGQISPSQLLGRVRSVYKRSFTRGNAGELGDLANIGQFIKESVPNSGTSQRTLARNILTGNVATAVPFGFVNPIIPMAQATVTGVAGGANRLLQNQNYNQQAIAKILQNPEVAMRLPGVVSGNISGQLARALEGK